MNLGKDVMNISQRLKNIRGQTSLKEFAENLGVHPNTITNYEKGRTPDADFLTLVCEKYKVNPTWLLIGDGDMKANGPGLDEAWNVLVSEWEEYHNQGREYDPTISGKVTRIAFVKAYNEQREDQWFDYESIPNWVKKFIPRINGKELEDWALRKKRNDNTTKLETITLGDVHLHAKLAVLILDAFKEYYADSYAKISLDKKAELLRTTYFHLCGIGASDDKLPTQEGITATVSMLIDFSDG